MGAEGLGVGRPAHQVTLTRDYFVGSTEITS